MTKPPRKLTDEDRERIMGAGLADVEALARDYPELFRAPRAADRWAYLPDHTREWLSGKSKADLDILDKMSRDYSAATTIGKFGKWLVVMIGAVFVGSWGLAKAGIEMFAWFKGGTR